MKAVLVQLPVQSHDYGYSLENVPLAGGYLKGCAEQGLGRGFEVEICPPGVSSLGGDAAILQWIEDSAPDAVGFSCYLWNIERSLRLCRKVRERLPRTRIVLGGPEVSPDNPLVGQAPFDAAVWGEGEETFLNLLASWSAGREELSGMPGVIMPGACIPSLRRRPPIISLDRIPSPYLGNLIEKSFTNAVFLETVRGCLYTCTYCSYHKQFRRLRCFDLGRTGAEILWAAWNGADEISFLDPCFARRPHIEDLLSLLEDARSLRDMKISCELNAEDVSEDLADRLARAGVRHVEIGLQTTNRRALKRCGRPFDEQKFIRGVLLLRAHDIHVVTDIMVGLPGDGPDDVKRSIDFVVDESLYDTLNLYPVSVLPDTPLRRVAAGQGITWLDLPPYYVVSTPDMGPDDIRASFAHASARTGIDYFPVELPRLSDEGRAEGPGGFVSRIVLDPRAGKRGIHPGRTGQALAIEVEDPHWIGRKERLRKTLAPVLEENPYTLLSWIVPEEHLRLPEAIELVREFSMRAGHPCDREFMSTGSALCSTRLFLRSPLRGSGFAYTHIPLTASRERLLSFLPEEADPGEEDYLTERLQRIMGRGVEIDFRDMPANRPGAIDARLGTERLSL